MTDNKELGWHTPEEFNGAPLIGVFETGSPEWHEARSRGIGGSEIGTIMGLNPWESAFALWAKRTGQIPDPPVDNWSVRFGKAFEDPILEMWQAEHPEYTVYKTGTYRHPTHDFIHANPDAIAQHDDGSWIVIEVKTARSAWKETPPAYVAQVQHYMEVLNLPRSVIVAVAGWTWEERWVDADQWQTETQILAATRFWEHLEQMVKPVWDGSKATYEAERHLHPEIEDDEKELGDLGLELLDAQERFDEAERDLLAIKAQVLDAMGNAKHGMVGEKRVAARQARGSGTPWLVVKRDQ